MSTKRQAKRHSGIGTLVQKRGRWYIVGHEITVNLDGTKTVKRPSKALPKDIATKADALREFNRRANEARAGKGQHRPTSRTVRALCEAWQTAQAKPHPLALSTAHQWANVQGDKALDNYATADLIAFRKVIEDAETVTRSIINAKMGCVRQIAKWGTATGYAPDGLLSRLQALAPLLRGKTTAAEGKGRTPASIEAFNKVLSHKPSCLPEPFRTILIILRWTGARPSEILNLEPPEVDTKDFPWIITKREHKTEAKGKARVFALPDPAEAALTPYLDRSPCFDPISDERLRMTLQRACKAAGVEVFTPYQLRHLRLTEIAQQCGPEAAQATAGHSSASMTLNYTKQAAEERALALAKAAALVGVE